MKKILFVLRDAVPTRIAVQLINILRLRGYEIVVIAEGEAVKVCKEAGLSLHTEGDANMSKIKTATILREINPSLVCIGCSSPVNWELQFAVVARRQKKKVVAISDIWGSLDRLKSNGTSTEIPANWPMVEATTFVPDLALVIDDYDAKSVIAGGLAGQVAIIGDIASQADISMPPEKRTWLNGVCSGFTSILLVGDHNRNALELADIATQCLLQSAESTGYVVFGSFVHPKLKKDPAVAPMLGRIAQSLSGFRFVEHEGISTDALAAYCDLTITCYSTPGRVALHNGKRFISLAGSDSLALLSEETGATTFPLVDRGIVPALTGSESMDYLLSRKFSNAGQAWAQTSKFDAAVAVSAITALLN